MQSQGSYLLALDEGTSSARAIVFDAKGAICGLGRRKFTQYFPQPGWVEHDADEIYRAQLAAAKAALHQAKIEITQVAAVGITNQRETTVLWDAENATPVGRAIVWQDRRTADYCQRLKAEGEEAQVRSLTGLPADPYFSATKIRWMLDHIPKAGQLHSQGRLRFGTIDTWLLWKLTGGCVHATDVSNASRTLLMDLEQRQWHPGLLERFGIPQDILPEIRPSASDFGTTTALGGDLPVAALIGDQQSATFGQACFSPGDTKNTYGTGCFLLHNTGNTVERSETGLLSTLAWQIGDTPTYALEGAIFSAGASMEWLVTAGIVASMEEATELAATSDNQGVYFVPAFAGLGAPHWDAYARGTIVGLTRGSGKAQLARAALEAMAYQSDEILQAFQQATGRQIRNLKVDGGAAANNFLMQFQADLSGVNVVRPAHTELTAWGAAAMAGLQVGVFTSLEEIAGRLETEKQFSPAREKHFRNTEQQRWQQAVARAKAWEPKA